MSFVSWGVYSEKTGTGWSPWSWWDFDVGLWAWRSIWPPTFSGWSYDAWNGLRKGLDVAWMLMTVLCVVAAIQVLRRGLAGAAVSGKVLCGFGVAALLVFIVRTVYWATAPDWHTLYVTDAATILGAVLIVVGGALLGAAPPRTAAPIR